MHAVVARSTFPSQNVQNTRSADYFWQLRCRKSARRCGAKHVSKSKCTKHHMATFGGSDVVSRGRRKGLCTLLKVTKREGCVAFSTTLHCTTLHSTTLHYSTLPSTTLHYTTLHYTTLHYTTLHYTTLHYITLPSTTLHYTTLHNTTTTTTQLHSTTLNYTPLH